ncbi:uncharacterized protein [Amphiura filiformis]|uniref:uncharacterized protein n=1 Tax=Amphiura filiformis TaxID=82378 RepID=UPI003B2207E9
MASFCKLVTVVLLSVFLLVTPQAPKPCCTPHVFTTGLATLTLAPQQSGQPDALISQEGDYYFDGPNKRVAINVTVQVLDSQQPSQQIYQINDFNKKMMYIIVDNTTCQKSPLSGDFPNNDCIPDNATFLGTVKLGESYAVNRWLIDAPPIRQDVTMTVDQCIPVTSVLTAQEAGITMTSQEYYNFKTSIDNPDEKFTPPSICNTASLFTRSISRIHRSTIKSPFMAL